MSDKEKQDAIAAKEAFERLNNDQRKMAVVYAMGLYDGGRLAKVGTGNEKAEGVEMG